MRRTGSFFAAFSLKAALPLAALSAVAAALSGCATTSGSAVAPASPEPFTVKPVRGKAFGGQQPVVGATIALYTYGTTGYGSAGTLLATATTDSTGSFNIDPSSIHCPSATTPVYLMSIGGNPGAGVNPAAVEAAGLGACASAGNDQFVVVNEVTTVALAYALSHFFFSSASDGTTADHFGSPASATATITAANSGTIPTLINVGSGAPNASTATVTLESAKLTSLANVLTACVNSAGPTSALCAQLFANSPSAGGTAPVDILQAAINIVQAPARNVQAIYQLAPTDGSAAFPGGLSTVPSDWTLAVSYQTTNFGLSLDTAHVATLDVDTAGRVWFASNAPTAKGVAFFDPASASFSPLFAGPGLQHPEQIAIDMSGTAWVTDSGSPLLTGFPLASPQAPVSLTLPGTTSTSLTVHADNTLRVAAVNLTTNKPFLAQTNSSGAYVPVEGTTIDGSTGYLGSSLASDGLGGTGIAGALPGSPTTFEYYYGYQPGTTPASPQFLFVAAEAGQDAGQVAFTGNDYAAVRGGYSTIGDGLCIYTRQNCFSMANQVARHPSGIAVDGAGTLWLADQNTATVEQVPVINGSYLNSSNLIPNQIFTHGSTQGGTLTTPTGIAVDRAGNVWVSNFGCNTTGCTPGPFVLSELIGAGAPAITPVSAQVSGAAGSEPQRKPLPGTRFGPR